MLPYLPTTLLQAGHPPTRLRPGAVIRRWQRNCPYKPLRGRPYAYTQNDRHHYSTGHSAIISDFISMDILPHLIYTGNKSP
nr:MAG TPA: hypothetical protein [Caudoviricetes sp.]